MPVMPPPPPARRAVVLVELCLFVPARLCALAVVCCLLRAACGMTHSIDSSKSTLYLELDL